MKKIIAMLLTLMTLLAPSMCFAESAYTGRVVAGGEEVICAPFGGHISEIKVQEGSLIRENTLLAELDTAKVYAPMDGQVTAVFASAGSSGEAIKEQYGAAIWIEPVQRYVIKCNAVNQQKSVENQWISIGEKVYIRNNSTRQREGLGIVTSISSKEDETGIYYVTVESGEFVLGESVSIFREDNYSQTSGIGSGKVLRNAPIAVNTSGTITALHVEPGDHVKVGSLLCETVNGSMPHIELCEIRNASTGVIANVMKGTGDTVEQGETIAIIYPQNLFQMEVQLPEACLGDVSVGDSASIAFHWMSGTDKRYPATIRTISYLGTNNQDGSNATYAVRLDFDADDTVRIGMTATVYLNLETLEETASDDLPEQQ